MKLELVRVRQGKASTLGKLYVDGVFHCYTLEDQTRPDGAKKVAKETAIPAGHYIITLRHIGNFAKHYDAIFTDIHHGGMLWLRDVPGFEYILIHCGNTDSDTAGCLLVGEGYDDSGDGFVLHNSKIAYRALYPIVRAACERGEAVFIEVTSGVKAAVVVADD